MNDNSHPIDTHIDDRIDTLDTHGWAYTHTDDTLEAWRYTQTGKETLTIALNQATPSVTVTLAGTTQLDVSKETVLDALDRAEHYMNAHPSSTAPAPAHTHAAGHSLTG